MPQRVQEGLGNLPREGASGRIGDGAGYHNGKTRAGLLEQPVNGKDRRLGIQGIEDGLDEDNICTTFNQCARGFRVGLDQFVKLDIAECRVIDVR